MPDDEIELRVERLTNGPDALARDAGGRVVFLDQGLPGELVRARVVEQRRDFARARVVEIRGRAADADPSPRRRPPCPVVAQCGGCPWQHIEYSSQLDFKLDVALREIWRTAGVRPSEVLPTIAGDQWRSRSRIRLAVARRAGGAVRELGYHGRASHRVVPFEDCAIAHAVLVAALPLARALAERETTIAEVELLVDDAGALRLRGLSTAPQPLDASRAFAALRREATAHDLRGGVLAGLSLESRPAAAPQRGRQRPAAAPPWRSLAGDCLQRVEAATGIELAVPLGCFTQVNLRLDRELVGEVVRQVGARPEMRVADLHCGAGNFALPLAAAGAEVDGVESDERAVEAARASAQRLGLEPRARFHAAAAESWLAGLLAGWPFDVVVLDPPRGGAAAAVAALLARRDAGIVYVSCEVATLARDLRALVSGGYALETLRLVDLTPQTHRAELIASLRLT